MQCAFPISLFVAVNLFVPAVFVPAAALADLPSHPTLRAALVQAEEALERGEPQIAESHLRDAQLDGLDLLGLLAVADGDLEAAHDAFEQATMAAVVGVQRPRRHLALVRGRLGETDAALNQLRALTDTFPRDARTWEALIEALVARGRVAEARDQIDDLHKSQPQIAGGLEALVADDTMVDETTAGADPGAGFSLDLGPLATHSSSERASLRREVVRDLAVSHLQLGWIHARAGRFERAIEGFRAALDLDPELDASFATDLAADDPRLVEARNTLSTSLSELARGHSEKSTDILRQAFLPAPSRESLPTRSVEGLLEVLDTLRESLVEVVREMEMGNFAGAEHWLHLVHEQGRSSPESHELLRILRADRSRSALLLLQLAAAAKHSQAKFQIALLDQAWLLAPNSEEVLAAHGRAHIRGGLWAKARRSLEPLAGIFPRNAEYAHLHGLTLMHLGEMADAAIALRRAVDNDPQRTAAVLDLGRVLNREKRYAEARAQLTALAELEPDNLDAQAALAETEEGLGELDAARQRAEAVLEQQVDHPGAHLVLGMIHMKSRRFAAARDALVATVEADPDNAKAHYQLSLAYARLGEREKAQHHLAIYERKAEGPETQLLTLVGDGPAKTLQPGSSPEETRRMKKNGGSLERQP